MRKSTSYCVFMGDGFVCHTSYGAFLDDYTARTKRGEEQQYCHTCRTWHWPDAIGPKCIVVPAGMCLMCEKRRPKRDAMLCRVCDPPGSPSERKYRADVRAAQKRGEL